ncbi:hypothetical protein M0R72_06615 [Candidatus Pacearchaeota archaeon]|jgi:hypothetical protein|nr:hypothetical protein [Candidatus Pacearchaeota archaeon]
MANIGDRFEVGTTASETGRYKHSACTNTIILNRGNRVPPCSMGGCPNQGAYWILKEKLT